MIETLMKRGGDIKRGNQRIHAWDEDVSFTTSSSSTAVFLLIVGYKIPWHTVTVWQFVNKAASMLLLIQNTEREEPMVSNFGK